MLAILEKLAILQDRDGQLLSLRRELDGIPVHKLNTAARLREAEKQAAEAQDRQKHALSAIRQAELDVEAAKEKTDRLRRQQFEIKSNDQYRALQHEIEAEVLNIRKIEDREIEVMELSEAAHAAGTSKTAVLADVQAAAEEEVKTLESRVEKLQGEISHLETERNSLTAGIEPLWLDRYDRLLARVGAHAIVAIVREICSGCHMKLPPQVIQDAKREQTICTCTFCGRMLYWKP